MDLLSFVVLSLCILTCPSEIYGNVLQASPGYEHENPTTVGLTTTATTERSRASGVHSLDTTEHVAKNTAIATESEDHDADKIIYVSETSSSTSSTESVDSSGSSSETTTAASSTESVYDSPSVSGISPSTASEPTEYFGTRIGSAETSSNRISSPSRTSIESNSPPSSTSLPSTISALSSTPVQYTEVRSSTPESSSTTPSLFLTASEVEVEGRESGSGISTASSKPTEPSTTPQSAPESSSTTWPDTERGNEITTTSSVRYLGEVNHMKSSGTSSTTSTEWSSSTVSSTPNSVSTVQNFDSINRVSTTQPSSTTSSSTTTKTSSSTEFTSTSERSKSTLSSTESTTQSAGNAQNTLPSRPSSSTCNPTKHTCAGGSTNPNSTEDKTNQGLLQFSKRILSKLRSNSSDPEFGCSVCRLFVDLVRDFWSQTGITRALASHFSISACIALRLQHPDVCRGIIRAFQNEFSYVFANSKLSSQGICSVMLDENCGDEDAFDKPWSVKFPDKPKPSVTEPSLPKPGSPVLKVLHLTDLHIDLNYQENTSVACGEPLCCRKSNGVGDAGFWGSYGCDIPMRTLDSALQHIKQNHEDISYILLTGDIPPHDVWQDTKSSQIEVMQRSFEKIKEYFPHKKVFVAAGNHDTHPTNSFPPPSVDPEYSIQWLLDSYADMWSAWLEDTSLQTVRKGGFYSTLVSPGFRIVSINNNYCNKLNWWLLVNNTDPAGELQWLIEVLQNAEDNGEKVHIIAHIPPGHDLCYKHWSRNYYEIINRYENTITAQFCGHTHQDHFEIFYDLNDHTRPVSVMNIAPSLTTNSAYQPAYRIYEIEGDFEHSSRRVLDYKTYKLDLEKSNRDREAYWELEYCAKDAYEMRSAFPSDWDDLVSRMANDENLFQKFYKFKYRYPKQGSCDKECKARELCALKTAMSRDITFCETTADHVMV